MNGKIKIRHIYKAEELKRFAKLEGKYHHMGETHSGGDTMRIVYRPLFAETFCDINHSSGMLSIVVMAMMSGANSVKAVLADLNVDLTGVVGAGRDPVELRQTDIG